MGYTKFCEGYGGLKTAVTKHPRDGEVVLNTSYEALAHHYGTVIMPAGVRKPRHKASVEGTVGKLTTSVIAALRDVEFCSLGELHEAIREKLDAFNSAPFPKRDHSRLEVFLDERESLRPLPAIPYEAAEWICGRKVGINCHVVFEKNCYSCPYQFAELPVDLKVTDRTLEIYAMGDRAATHSRASTPLWPS